MTKRKDQKTGKSRAMKKRRLLEDIIRVRHLPTHTVKEYRKYRLNGGRTVEVETLSEMEVRHA